jgi:hypothetical protein
LRLAGAFFFAALRAVAFFAGGTVTTFLGELSLREVRTSGSFGAQESESRALHGYPP